MNSVYRFLVAVKLMPNSSRKDSPLSTKPKGANQGSMQCIRCKEETSSLSYGPGKTVKDGVCPTCALIIGMPDNDGFPAMVVQALQLVDAGLADLPAIINELHGRVCGPDTSEHMRQDTLARVARWKKGLNN